MNKDEKMDRVYNELFKLKEREKTDMTVAECTHFAARSEWVHLPSKSE